MDIIFGHVGDKKPVTEEALLKTFVSSTQNQYLVVYDTRKNKNLKNYVDACTRQAACEKAREHFGAVRIHSCKRQYKKVV